MAKRAVVTDADIASAFRRLGLHGSAVDAITNPALRICLANCAELRKKQEQPDQHTPDRKRLAAGDTE